ncbi:uncharacterized protein V1510DRAFT_422575 [Dipodascopsis tothii]|uniref:uncharacterized protein n=1 Tax=Dipodascopsis tothii TaxID=44089 RepID=UPI0034CFE76A
MTKIEPVRLYPTPLAPPEGIRRWQTILGLPGAAAFGRADYETAMINLILHPNINSSNIIRADILLDTAPDEASMAKGVSDFGIGVETTRSTHFPPETGHTSDFFGPVLANVVRRIVRVIVPRNTAKDQPLLQSCLLIRHREPARTLAAVTATAFEALPHEEFVSVMYVPHVSGPDEIPFYHPNVAALVLTFASRSRNMMISYRFFDGTTVTEDGVLDNRLERTALRLLQTAHKHSQGVANGYKKRVHHDQVVAQVPFQTRYAELKARHAHTLIERWVESTDPKKHVFEDLAIAAFLIELWRARAATDAAYAADRLEFVDVGCGNGVLVYILLSEGYRGYGLDARRRKTWATFPEAVQAALHEQVLVPDLAVPDAAAAARAAALGDRIHARPFGPDTFLIGNHSDELTPWIPLLGRPFMVIPCCSHALSGAKHRYPVHSAGAVDAAGAPVKLSTYGALVEHVATVAAAVGWAVEREMLRIPSTRNAAILGLERAPAALAPADVVARAGGAAGFLDRSVELMAKSPRTH